MGPHGVLVGATGSGQERAAALAGGRAGRHARARAARLRARRLQGRRRVRRPVAAAARRRPDHQPAARPVACRPHARGPDRRAGAAPDDAARGRQPRRHRLLPGAPRGRSVDAADARPAGDRRRVRRAARRAAGVHRPLRRARARRPVARHPPAAVVAAARRGPPAWPGEPPALPPVPADVLGGGVQARAGDAGRLPAALDAGARLSEGRHREVRAVPRRAGLRPSPGAGGDPRGAGAAGARLRAACRDGAPSGGGRSRSRGRPARTSCRCWSTAWPATVPRCTRCGWRRCRPRRPSTQCWTTRRGGTAASAPKGCAPSSAGSTARQSSARSRSRSTSGAPAATWRWSGRRARARARCCARSRPP